MKALWEKYKKFILVLGVVLFLAIAGAAAYFAFQFYKLKQNPQAVAEREISNLVEKVGRLIVLPEGEMPTLATVTDPERLKDQLFFAGARKGDKVLIFTNAKKAILYRPSEHKIVEVAPLNIGVQN